MNKMREPMAIESLPSWMADNKDYPRENYLKESNYIMIAVAAILMTSLVAVLIVNYKKEKTKKDIKD